MLLEFAPDSGSESLKLADINFGSGLNGNNTPPSLDQTCETVLNEIQEEALKKAHSLLGFHAATAGYPDR